MRNQNQIITSGNVAEKHDHILKLADQRNCPYRAHGQVLQQLIGGTTKGKQGLQVQINELVAMWLKTTIALLPKGVGPVSMLKGQTRAICIQGNIAKW